jgi:hypothetical protein
MLKIILVVLLIWASWLGYQYFNKSETANMLIKQKMEEFYVTDVNVLLQKLGKGYEYKTVEVNGKKFWVSWLFYRKDTDTIEMSGRVDFIELLPFSNFRLGFPFKSILKIK